MNPERDKFLTEAMNLCWHEFYHGRCNCGIYLTSNWNNTDFSTWEGFGVLKEWAETQKWWGNFVVLHSSKLSHTANFISDRDISLKVINPDRFADAVCAFLKEAEK